MNELDQLERLARWQAGELEEAERLALEAELAASPEQRALLKRLEGLDVAVAALPLEDVAPKAPLSRWWAVAAALIAVTVGWALLSQSRVSMLEGRGSLRQRTLVAGESVWGSGQLLTDELSAAEVRRGGARYWLGPSGALEVPGATLRHGFVVVNDGEAQAGGVSVQLDGQAVLSMEPLTGAFRETKHLEPGALVNPKMVAVVAGGVGAVVLYVLSGTAQVRDAQSGAAPVTVRASEMWRQGSGVAVTPTPSVPVATPVTKSVDAGPVVPGVAPGFGIPGSLPVRAEDADVVTPVGALRGNASDGGAVFPFDRDGIKNAVASIQPDLHDCYESWLSQRPDLAGRMVMGFTISADDAGTSSVSRVEIVDGGMGHVLMEGCVKNAFEGLKFDVGDGEILVHYPLAFSSEPDAGP